MILFRRIVVVEDAVLDHQADRIVVRHMRARLLVEKFSLRQTVWLPDCRRRNFKLNLLRPAETLFMRPWHGILVVAWHDQ